MKKLLSVFLSFVLILSVVLIPSVTGLVYAEETTPETDGLPTKLVNPTFSTTEGWEISNDNGVPQTETVAISGGKAQFTPGDVAWVGLKQTIAVTPDVPYVIQFEVCLDAASEDGIQFNVNDTQFSYPGNAAAFDGQVYRLKIDYTPTIDTLTLSIKNKSGKCTGTLDNIYVYKKGEEPPIEYPTEIQNGTFETGVEGWAVGDDNGNPVANSPVIKDGQGVFADGNTAWSGFQQTIAVENEAEYIVKFNINITSGTGVQFKMTGAGLSSNGVSEINFPNFGVLVNGSTYTFSQKITTTDNKLKIRFGTRGTNTVAYIDNVSVTRCETTTSVVNGDFSTDSNWLICNSNNGTAIANAPVISDGKVTFTADAPVNSAVIQEVAVTPGKTYTFKFDISNTGTAGLVASVRYKNGNNYTSLAWLTANNYGLSTDGAVHTYQCNVTPTTDTVEIAFIKNNAANAGWIDNVSLKEYVIPTEIQNSTFEDGVDGWIIANDSGFGVANPPVIQNGQGVFSATDTNYSSFSQTVAVENGTNYMLSFDYFVESGNGIQVKFNGATQTGKTTNEFNYNTATSWVTRVVIPITTTAEEFKLSFKNRGSTVGYVDNVFLYKEGEEPEIPALPEEPEEPVDPTIGAGIVSVDGDFASADNWTLASGTSISNGNLMFDGTQAVWTGATQEISLKPNTNYGVVCLHHLDAGRIQVAVKINGRNAFGEYAGATVRNKVFRYNTTFNSGVATVATLVVNGTEGTTLAVGAVDLVQVVELDADGNMIDVEGNIIEAITDGDNNGLMGDLNGDYYVNLLDMVRMKKVLAGVEVDYNADAADIDTATAGVDAQDIAALKQFVLGFAKSEYVLFG